MTELKETMIQTQAQNALIETPTWVAECVDLPSAHWEDSSDGITVRRIESPSHALVSMVVHDARHMSGTEFIRCVDSVYESLHHYLGEGSSQCPIRMWNHIPGILDPVGNGMNRYHLLNQARHEVYCRWYGTPDVFKQHVVTATCTGHGGNDFIYHCLAAPSSGIGIENPRQDSSYLYSKRYGPKPPCFARATLLPVDAAGQQQVLVGGTASVRGEDSLFSGDLAGQLNETLSNMVSILGASARHGSTTATPTLSWYSDIRVYYKHEVDRCQIESAVVENFSPDVSVEWVHAPICRDELLVEIEGRALVSDCVGDSTRGIL